VYVCACDCVAVMSDLLAAHVKIDVDKMKTEIDLHKKYIVCEHLGRCARYHVMHHVILLLSLSCNIGNISLFTVITVE